jgi:hypothetical protein
MADIMRIGHTNWTGAESSHTLALTRAGGWLNIFVELGAKNGRKAWKIEQTIDEQKSDMGVKMIRNFFSY